MPIPQEKSGTTAPHPLHDGDARYRALVESLDDLVFLLDEEGRHVAIHGALLVRRGFGADLFLGRTARDIMGPDAAAPHEAAHRRAMTGEHFVYDWSSGAPEEPSHWQTTLAPLRDADGRIVGVAGVGRDITAQRRAEAQLRERDAIYRTLVRHLPNTSVLLVDRDLRFLVAEGPHFAAHGLTTERIVGRTLHEVLPPAGVASLEPQYRRLLAGDTLDFPLEAGARQYEVKGRPVRNDAGDIVAGLITAHDVTEQRQLEGRIQAAQRLESVGRLAAGVAHDFNNVLTVVTGTTELLAASLGDGHPALADLDGIRDAAARASTLTRHLLAFGRQQVLAPRVLDLWRLVRECEPMIRHALPADVVLELRGPRTPWRTRADPQQLERVLLNLVLNARDAMPGGGRLRVFVANRVVSAAEAARHPPLVAGEHVALVVADTGIGIEADQLTTIFEPFTTTKPAHTGSGLGLAMAHGVVQQSGGAILVRSTPGRGARFTILLPRIADDGAGRTPTPESSEAIATQNGPRPPGGAGTVLVVEDEVDVRTMVRRLLVRRGWTVLEAVDGLDALDRLATCGGAVDLVLTDVVMPRMGGGALVRAIAESGWSPALVVMSGYSNDAVLRRGELPDGAVFLEKPFATAALDAAIEAASCSVGRAGPTRIAD